MGPLIYHACSTHRISRSSMYLLTVLDHKQVLQTDRQTNKQKGQAQTNMPSQLRSLGHKNLHTQKIALILQFGRCGLTTEQYSKRCRWNGKD